jgi:hypothetical protein
MSFPAGSRYHEDIHDSPLSRHEAERADAIVQLWTAQEALRRRPDGVLALVATDITRNTAARHPSSHHHLWDWGTREPLARYAVIPDAGHASNLDNPDDFTDLLTAFIDDVAAEAAVKAQATRPHYREPVAAGIDGQGQPLLRAAS